MDTQRTKDFTNRHLDIMLVMSPRRGISHVKHVLYGEVRIEHCPCRFLGRKLHGNLSRPEVHVIWHARQTYCSTNHLNFSFPPLRVQPFFLTILDVCMVYARFDTAVANRLDALSN